MSDPRHLRPLLLVASLLVAHGAQGQTPPPATPDALIARHLEARGGAARLKGLKAIRFTGALRQGMERVHIEILKKRPALFRLTLGAGAEVHGGGFDGAAWTFDRGGSVRISGPAAKTLEHAAEFDDSFVDYKAKGNTVELVGLQPLEGKTYLMLRVQQKDGLTKEYYFDPQTFLVAADWKGPAGSERGEGQLTLRQDYRAVGGLLFPFVSVERDPVAGTAGSELRWDLIELNAPLEAGAFVPPPGA